MKVSENDNTQFLAEPDPLVARLLRRYTHASGIIDTHHTQKRHDKLVGWLESRFPVAAQLMQRCRSDDGQALQPEQMIYPNSFWHSGQVAGQTNLFARNEQTYPINFDSVQPTTSGLPNVSETLVDSHDWLDQHDIGHNQKEPLTAVWRLRRAASTISPAATEVPDNPKTPTPTKATTVERKAINNQTINNVAGNKENNNQIQQADLSLTQANNPFTYSGKPSTIAKAKFRPAANLPSKTSYKENQGESLTYPLAESNATQNTKNSTVSTNQLSKHSKIARTRELSSPEIAKPNLFVAQSPKGSLRADRNKLIKPILSETNDGAVSHLQSENHRENSALANKPAVTEVITPNTQTISPRFSKKEWSQLIESVSKVIGDKLLADLDRRGIRIWR
jgi:hypothetical protein